MNMVAVVPQSLALMLRIFSEGERNERVSLSRLEGVYKSHFSDSLELAGRLTVAGAESYRAHAAVATLTRLVWSLVPTRLLTATSPDFRGLAHKALSSKFGELDDGDDLVASLTVIFKRIRQYYKLGRMATSLDLELGAHQDLLRAQGYRCNHCLYEFKAEEYFYSSEDEGIPAESESHLVEEISLRKTFRRPELDHIIPIIFGGDNPENWQILCKSCNLGKSDQLGYLSSVMSNASNRMGYLTELTPGKRYAAIAEFDRQKLLIEEGKYLRVFRIEPMGFLNPENLQARFC